MFFTHLMFHLSQIKSSNIFQPGKSSSTASAPPPTAGTNSPYSKKSSRASPTNSLPSTNPKASVNTAVPSLKRPASAMGREWCVGANLVVVSMRSRWIRQILQMDMSRCQWGRGWRCRLSGRLSRRRGVGCRGSICLLLLLGRGVEPLGMTSEVRKGRM